MNTEEQVRYLRNRADFQSRILQNDPRYIELRKMYHEAANALAQRESLEARVEELESGYLENAQEFDKDCWKALRKLVTLTGYDWNKDGELTADEAREQVELEMAYLHQFKVSQKDFLEQREELLKHRATLIAVGRTMGCYLHDDVSNEFLGHLAEEAKLKMEQREALAAQVVVLREELGNYAGECKSTNAALNLTLPEAAAQVAAWKEGHENWQIFKSFNDMNGDMLSGRDIKAWRENSELLAWLLVPHAPGERLAVYRVMEMWNGEDSFLDYCRAQFAAKDGK